MPTASCSSTKSASRTGIRVIADHAHSLGLKAGIYADGGDNTCGYYFDREDKNGLGVGLYGFEKRDLTLYLEEYGFDFIKVNWCGGVRLGLDEKTQYTKIADIINEIRKRTGKQIVYNICRWHFPGAWAAEVADSWRTGADITPDFDSIMYQLDMIKPLARYCSPGHVNDLDMMQLGNGLSRDEEETHFAMWCMMSTPHMIGCDLTKISNSTLSILKNRDLIAVNQNSACLQAFVIDDITDINGNKRGEVWIKDLGQKNSPEKAIAFLNRGNEPLDFAFDISKAGLLDEVKHVRDLCKNEDITPDNILAGHLKPHGIAVYKVAARESVPVENRDDTGEIKRKPIRKISLDEATALVKQGAVLADVRTESEYDEGHLENAVNLSYLGIHAMAPRLIPDKKRTIIVYCATGKRSE